MKRVKTAILGSGFMGRVHLEAVRRLGHVDVVAIASVDMPSAQKLASEFNIERVESDYHKVIADPSVKAVHICTPNSLHYQMAKDALAARKNLLCEKPLATSLLDAKELVELAARLGCATLSITTCATTRSCKRCAG
jgi:predicted dehydrogenase